MHFATKRCAYQTDTCGFEFLEKILTSATNERHVFWWTRSVLGAATYDAPRPGRLILSLNPLYSPQILINITLTSRQILLTQFFTAIKPRAQSPSL